MKLNQIHSYDLIPMIPSYQDLISAVELSKLKNEPSVIYADRNNYIVIQPSPGRLIKLDQSTYNKIVADTIKSGDINVLIDGLRKMGFELSGNFGKRFGKIDQMLHSKIKQVGMHIPQSSKEIGGEVTSDMSVPKLQTGTERYVNVRVKYDPKELLKRTDKSNKFMFHTHPKLVNNNYFPGKISET